MTNRPLGYLQQQMFDFLAKTGGLHTVPPDYETVRIAKSLERRGLIHLTDCGMCTTSGRTVYMACITNNEQ